MEIIYGLLGVIISIIFILKAYEKTIEVQFSKLQKILSIIIYVVFANVIAGLVPSFLLLPSAVTFLMILIFSYKRHVNLAALFISFSINQVVLFFSASGIGMLTYLIFNEPSFALISSLILAIEVGIYFLILKSKFMIYTKIISNLGEAKKRVVVQSFFLMFIVIILREFFNNLYHLFDPITFIILLIIMTGVALFLSVNLINESKKHVEKMQLEQEVAKQLEIIDDLTSQAHSYKNGIRLIAFLLQELNLHIERDGEVDGSGNIFDLTELIENFENLVMNLGSDVAHEAMARHVKSLDIPNEWWELKLTLVGFLEQAHTQNVFLEVANELKDWNELAISGLKLARLIENFVSNALKELAKMDNNGKLVVVRFYKNEAGFSAFEVADNAHEFPIDILLNLGKRKNSTNETGDGYFEVFEILDEIAASFLIEEKHFLDQNHKKIMVIFDGNHRREIKSDFRQEQLSGVFN